jgi:N-hydroxyarylamine O-acetyltransferase
MTTSPRDELFRRYLGILGWVGDPGLHELVSSHLIKVPFENVSQLLLPADAPRLPPMDEFLRGIADQDLGGTCYAIASHFAELLRFLDYDVELLGADSGGVPRAHAVCRVRFEDQYYLVDVGYGAPFYHPIAVAGPALPQTVLHGDINYVVDRHVSHGEAIEVASVRGGARVSSYVAKPPAIDPQTIATAFGPAIDRSFAPDAQYMRRLRISRFFASRVLEVYNNVLVTTHHNITTHTPIRDIDELEAIVHEAMQLPRMPVREAVDVLAARGVDIFA